RRVDRQLGLLVQLRRVAPLLLDLGEPRAQRPRVVDRGRRRAAGGATAFADQLRTRHVEVVQVEVDERGFAGAAQVAVDLAEPAQPVVVLVVDDVGLADQLAVVALGVDPPALLDQRLSLIRRRLDRVERAARHQRWTFILRLVAGSVGGGAVGGCTAFWTRVASPTMSSARRWRSAREVRTSPETICERSSNCTNSGSISLDGSTTTPY